MLCPSLAHREHVGSNEHSSLSARFIIGRFDGHLVKLGHKEGKLTNSFRFGCLRREKCCIIARRLYTLMSFYEILDP